MVEVQVVPLLVLECPRRVNEALQRVRALLQLLLVCHRKQPLAVAFSDFYQLLFGRRHREKPPQHGLVGTGMVTLVTHRTYRVCIALTRYPGGHSRALHTLHIAHDIHDIVRRNE